MHLRMALLLGYVLLAQSTAAPSASAQSDQLNAATWYQKTIEQLGGIPEDSLNPIFDFDWKSGPPTAEVRVALGRVQPILTLYQRGAIQEYCDFGLDRSQGFDLMLPHLGQMRQVVRVMQADAMVRLHDGDTAGAAQRLATAYRSTAHFGDDRTLISTLVGANVFRIADEAVQAAIDRGAFGPAEAAALLRETERLASLGDPFNFLGSAVTEQEVVVEWVQERRQQDDFVDQVNELFGGESPEGAEIAALDDQGFQEAVMKYDAAMDRAFEILAMDDLAEARAQMAEHMEDVLAGEYGPLMALSFVGDRVLEQKIRADEMLAKRIESLRPLARGEVQPEEVANAAVWYFRAVEMIGQMPPADLELLRHFVVDDELAAEPDAHTLGRALEPLLLLNQSIIDVLRDGSIKRRCDFSIVYTPTLALAPVYAHGMRDALRLVHADALRLMRLHKFDDAAARLAIGYRMVAHLSGDPYMACSIIAHRGLLEAHGLAELFVRDRSITDEQRQVVHAAFHRIDPGDAFGYITSRQRTAHLMLSAAQRVDRLAKAGAGSNEEVNELLSEMTADSQTNADIVRKADEVLLLTYLAMNDYSYQPERESWEEEAADDAEDAARQSWAALHDVLDIDVVMDVREEAPAFGERLRSNHRFTFHTVKPHPINTLADRRHRARADIRTTSSLLRDATTAGASDDEGEDDDDFTE